MYALGLSQDELDLVSSRKPLFVVEKGKYHEKYFLDLIIPYCYPPEVSTSLNQTP